MKSQLARILKEKKTHFKTAEENNGEKSVVVKILDSAWV